MQVEALQQLLGYYDRFVREANTGDLSAFGAWLSAQSGAEQMSSDAISFADEGSPEDVLPENPQAYQYSDLMPPEFSITLNIIRLFRFVHNYTKRTLKEFSDFSFEEFGMMMAVQGMREGRKSDVIASTLFEVTTGTEILKRLIADGYVEEAPHPTDGRAKVVRVTPKGQAFVDEVIPKMSPVHNLLIANLTEPEIHQLAALLTRLNTLHSALHFNHRQEAIPTLVSLARTLELTLPRPSAQSQASFRNTSPELEQ